MAQVQPITITIPRATPAEVRRGIAAALAEFEKAGVEPLVAAIGLAKREAWGLSGFNEEYDISETELAAAQVWDEAEEAARECANADAGQSSSMRASSG